MSRFKEQELIQALKSTGATKQNPATVTEIHDKLNALEEIRAGEANELPRTIDSRSVSRNLRQLLGTDEEIEQIKLDAEGNGLKEKKDYYLGFRKRERKITGYWYEKKIVEDVPGEFPRFLMDAVIYSKVLTPEFKPDYYSNLQDIFGCGQASTILTCT